MQSGPSAFHPWLGSNQHTDKLQYPVTKDDKPNHPENHLKPRLAHRLPFALQHYAARKFNFDLQKFFLLSGLTERNVCTILYLSSLIAAYIPACSPTPVSEGVGVFFCLKVPARLLERFAVARPVKPQKLLLPLHFPTGGLNNAGTKPVRADPLAHTHLSCI